MTSLATIEVGLVNVYESKSKDRVVSGRELHEFLEIGTRYDTWFKRMIEYGFVEGSDFIAVAQKRATAQGNETTFADHHMKLDMSKEVSMLQRNEKGKMARQYFIEVEKKYQQQNQLVPMSVEDMIIQQAMNHKETRLKLEALEKKQEETESNVVEIKSYLTDSPDSKTIELSINKYARRNNMQSNEVRSMVYKKIEDLYGVDVMQRAKNAQKKLQDDRIVSGKKPYADSTLKSKVSGMDIIKEENLEKAMLEILAGSQ